MNQVGGSLSKSWSAAVERCRGCRMCHLPIGRPAMSEPRLFKPRLLVDPDIVFVSQGDDGTAGGRILNRGAEVVGLSNLWRR
jgi:hypothetical protein